MKSVNMLTMEPLSVRREYMEANANAELLIYSNQRNRETDKWTEKTRITGRAETKLTKKTRLN